MDKISDKITDYLLSVLNPKKFSFSKIKLSKGAFLDMSEFAHANHPREFVALLQGKVIEDELVIQSIFYQPFNSNSKTAFITFGMPYMPDMIGSVHSHPSSNLRPSEADLRFFNKKGGIHMIIGYPYKEETIACYDSYGNELEFKTG